MSRRSAHRLRSNGHFRIFKMAVSRHLGFDGTGNSTIPSAVPENMEWIGCTVCEIFAFKLYYDLETGVQGCSRSSIAAPFNKAHATLYSSSTVYLLGLPFARYSGVFVENRRTRSLYSSDGRTDGILPYSNGIA